MKTLGSDPREDSPATRLPAHLYMQARTWLLEHDPDAQRIIEWSADGIAPPSTPESLAMEITWIVLCAGRSAQAARTIERRVTNAIANGRPVLEVFGHRGKAEAIDKAWREKFQNFERFIAVLARNDQDALVEWCRSLPYVGPVTCYQLAKNCGANLAKPDRWLARLAGIPDVPAKSSQLRFKACMALCRYLAAASGDRIPTVDSVLWLACNKGVLTVSPDAGDVAFAARSCAGRSIYGTGGVSVPGCVIRTDAG